LRVPCRVREWQIPFKKEISRSEGGHDLSNLETVGSRQIN
jgi:hypothetical protein